MKLKKFNLTHGSSLLNLDLTKCFICQEKEPTHKVTSPRGEFKTCDECTANVIIERKAQENILKSIALNDRTHIFQYTLGMPTYLPKINIEKL